MCMYTLTVLTHITHTHVYISIFFADIYIYICIYIYTYKYSFIYIYTYTFFWILSLNKKQAPRWGKDFDLSWEFLCQWHSNEIIIVLVSRMIRWTLYVYVYIYICQNFCRHNFNTTGFFGSYFFLQFCISSKRWHQPQRWVV